MEIVASDAFADRALRDRLMALCDAELTALRAAANSLDDATSLRFRAFTRARFVEHEGRSHTHSDATLAVMLPVAGQMHAVVSTAPDLARDVALLRSVAAQPVVPGVTSPDPRSLPLVWCNGSAAVLLHEAAGHAAECGRSVRGWPAWLRVVDEPETDFDDAGRVTVTVDLLTGDAPSSLRRQTFRDVPIPRMSSVVVSQDGAPFDVVRPNIEIRLVSGGRFEPLTGVVTIFVSAAALVTASGETPLAPFTFQAEAVDIARTIQGATGDPIRYPGVICSSEGQEIVVGSFAPVVITAPLS
jgi:hypothetical protein